MEWKQLLAVLNGAVDAERLSRNAYLVTENRRLCTQMQGRVRLRGGECQTLAVLGKRLGKKSLKEVASMVMPDPMPASRHVTRPPTAGLGPDGTAQALFWGKLTPRRGPMPHPRPPRKSPNATRR